MWQEIFNNAGIFFAVILTGCAVKITDDFLDQEADLRGTRHVNWAAKLGNGAMVYAIIFIIIAGTINAAISFALFLSSYAVGMFHDLNRYFPSKLRGWHESAISIGVGVLSWGWRIMFFAFFLIAVLQLIDDCLDYSHDRNTGQRNWVEKIGFVETAILSLIGILLCYLLHTVFFYPVIIGCAVFYITEVSIQRCCHDY